MTATVINPVGERAPIPDVLPLMPIGNAVLFPAMLLPIVITNDHLVQLVDEVMSSTHTLAVYWYPQNDEPPDDRIIGQVGVGAHVVRMLRLPEGGVQLLLHGQSRIRITEVLSRRPYLLVRVAPLPEAVAPSLETEGLMRSALTSIQEIVSQSPTLPDDLAVAAANVNSPGALADLLAANLNLKPEERQDVLQTLPIGERLHLVLRYLEREREILAIGHKVQEEVSRTQREYVLRQQLEAIRHELGEDNQVNEAADLRQRLEAAGLPDEARREAERELDRLEHMPPAAAEYVVARTYLDWILGLPWNTATEDNTDLARARTVLDEDHYGLTRIKERIVEYMAVRKLQHAQGETTIHGPILCFVGPPGVGKTSLGISIARALGRRFMRVALGGVRDEAEIRGHRRTYVGALPGRILQGISRAGSNNPVIMLDEVDKLAVSYQGDPAAALLELLDPAQNCAFVDRYLDVAFDLSRALFICTANRPDTVPAALLDRMEVLELAGYTDGEKVEIARRHLIPRQIHEQALNAHAPRMTDALLHALITAYTHEAGVRELERQIGAVYRKLATRFAEGTPLPETVDAADLEELLGPPHIRRETLLGADEIGVATGLAYTPAGGDVLFVEASVMPGHGELILTGQLGDVMKESARAALTFATAHAAALGLPDALPHTHDIHIHVPAGAVPKDGPSAGVTIACALVSALTNRPVRKQVAMTGEITLRGRVLPIGGLQEKLLAAQRAGVRTVLLPAENAPDLCDIPGEILTALELVQIHSIDEVLQYALYPVDAAEVSAPVLVTSA